jgi:hypothetical protein
VRTAFWWWIDRSIVQIRDLTARASSGSPLADLDLVFPAHTAGIRRVPLPR